MRFPEFSGEWKCTTIGNIGDIKNGPFGSVLHAEDYVENGIPIVTTEHFKTGLMPSDKFGIPQVSNEDYIRLKGYRLETNDIVFSRVGSVDINAHVGIEQNGWLFSGRVLRVRPKYDIDSLFLHYALSTEAVKRDIRNRAVGQTMPSINTPILSSTTIQLPKDLFEQKKVAHFLRLLDERIITQNKIIEDLKKLKSAIVDYIFNNEVLSFRKRIHLSDVATKITQKNTNNHVSNVLSNSANQGIIPQSEVFDREIANEDNTSNYFVISQNDFVYNPRKSATAPYGPINRYNGQTYGVISPLYLCFRSHNIDVEYLGWYFKSDSWHKYVYQNGDTGVRHDRVSIKDEFFFSMPLFIHNADEQIEIAKRLNKIESFVKQEEQYLFLLESQKLYLLQQMFI